jgi:hypothetical protein
MQKSILQIVQQAAQELNLVPPTVVITATDPNIIKLLSLARALGDDLLKEHDWQMLSTRYSFNTVNGQEAYSLPTDMESFIEGTFFDGVNRWPLAGSKSPQDWEWLKVRNVTSPFTRFRVYNNQMFINPIPGTTTLTFNFEYISNNWIKSVGGVAQNDFIQDSDISLFDHRLMVYGLKWKWRSSNGQNTSDELADFTRVLDIMKGRDTPAEVLNLRGRSGYPYLSNDNYPDGNWR